MIPLTGGHFVEDDPPWARSGADPIGHFVDDDAPWLMEPAQRGNTPPPTPPAAAPTTPLPERVGRDIAAGALTSAADLGALIGYAAHNVPGGTLPGIALTQKMAEFENWISENVAPPEHGFGDQLAQVAGNMATMLLPGVGVGAMAGKALTAAEKVERGAKFLTAIGRIKRGGKAMEAGAALARGTKMAAGGVASVAMSGIESSMEAGGTIVEKMREGKSVTQSGQEANEVLWKNLWLTIPTNYGFFHPLSRMARVALKTPTNMFQEAAQQMIQNDALDRPLWEGVPNAAAIGAIIGGVAAGVMPGESGGQEDGTKPGGKRPPKTWDGVPTPEGYEAADEAARPAEADHGAPPTSAEAAVAADMGTTRSLSGAVGPAPVQPAVPQKPALERVQDRQRSGVSLDMVPAGPLQVIEEYQRSADVSIPEDRAQIEQAIDAEVLAWNRQAWDAASAGPQMAADEQIDRAKQQLQREKDAAALASFKAAQGREKARYWEEKRARRAARGGVPEPSPFSAELGTPPAGAGAELILQAARDQGGAVVENAGKVSVPLTEAEEPVANGTSAVALSAAPLTPSAEGAALIEAVAKPAPPEQGAPVEKPARPDPEGTSPADLVEEPVFETDLKRAAKKARVTLREDRAEVVEELASDMVDEREAWSGFGTIGRGRDRGMMPYRQRDMGPAAARPLGMHRDAVMAAWEKAYGADERAELEAQVNDRADAIERQRLEDAATGDFMLFGGAGFLQAGIDLIDTKVADIRDRLATRAERGRSSKILTTDTPEMVDRIDRKNAEIRRLRNDKDRSVRRMARVIYKKHVSDTALFYDATKDALGGVGVDYEALPAGKKVEWVLRLARAASGRAKYFIDHGVRDPFDASKKWSKGLQQILAEHGLVARWDQFNEYLKARARIDRLELELSKGVSDQRELEIHDLLDSDRDLVGHYAEESGFESGANDVTQFTQATLRYARDCGAISHELYNKLLTTYPNYVPLNILAKLHDVSPSGRGVNAGLAPAVRKAGDATDEVIVDPLWQIQKNTYFLIQLAHANLARRTFVELHEEFKEAELARRLKPNAGLKMAPTWKTAGELLKAAGLGAKDVKAVQEQLSISDSDLDLYKALWGIARNQGPGVITVGREVDVLDEAGNRVGTKWESQFWQVDDDVFEAFTSLGKAHAVEAMRVFTAQTRFLRAGATLTFEFGGRNLLRDATGAPIFAKYLMDHPGDALRYPGALLRAVGHVIKQDEMFQQTKAAGVGMAESYALDLPEMEEAEAELLRSSTKERVFYRIRHPINGLRFLSGIAENTTRTAVFELTLPKQLARAARGEISVYDAYVSSAMEAREASVDFNRAGELGRTYNSFFAFYNASVQGPDKFNRTFFKDAGKGKAWLRGISLITMPSLLLWAINHDEDWYKELDPYRKNSFWFFSPDHGKTIWFSPKPFEVGMVFGSLPERLCDEAFKVHPEQMNAWARKMLQNLNPFGSPVPLTWAIIQAAANHDFRMDRLVIPRGLETVEARYQYDENTSEFSKMLGDMIPTKGGKGVSPKAIDFVIRGGAGGLGRYFTDLASAAIILFDPNRYREKPSVPKAFIPLFNTSIRTDIPLLRAFVTAGPNRNPESIEKFYDFLGESQEAISTLAELGKHGRAKADIPDYIRRRGMWLMLAEQLEARGRQMSEINSEIRAYQKDDGHLGTPQERRVKIDSLLEFRTEQAQQAVALVEGLRSDPDAMAEILDRATAEVEDALARQEAEDQLLRGNRCQGISNGSITSSPRRPCRSRAGRPMRNSTSL